MANPPHIVDPFPKAQTSWTFADHRNHKNPATGRPYSGGIDKVTFARMPVTAGANGVARKLNDGLNTVQITYANGKTFNHRENLSYVGEFPRRVKVGDVVALAGRAGGKYAHHDIEINGVREDPSLYYFTPLTKARVKAEVDQAFLDYKGRKASRASHLLWDGRIYRTNSDLHLLRVKLRDAKK